MGEFTNTKSCPRTDISAYPKLDLKQAGHIRHFHNLVTQPDGEWKHFSTKEYYQEFDDAIRYQLATMCYAASAAHFHRLNALRGPFKTLMRQMIHKMLRREVWNYWFASSVGSKRFDPSMTELRMPWADPVKKENIMYSGHLLLMTSLYAMLFNDDEFEKEDGIILDWDPLFMGLGPEKFVYSNRSLQDVIVRQMEENGWVGVCCEPNAVFVVCNQFPIVAMRYNDVRDGTDNTSKLLEKYKAALIKKGMFTNEGLYAAFFAVKQGKAIPAMHGSHTAWANAFMNGWDSENVKSQYDKQTMGFLTDFTGKTELNPTRVAVAFRKLVSEEGADPKDANTLRLAQDPKRHVANAKPPPFETMNWGCFTMMLSELGKEKELNDLLEYADAKLNPTWEDGGLYYPRSDVLADEQWHLTHMDPHSGNGGVAYARLNVPDGQRTMWQHAWTNETLQSRPWVDGVAFSDDIDFLRASWDSERSAMVLTMRRWTGESRSQPILVRNLQPGKWAVYVNGTLQKAHDLSTAGDVEVTVEIGGDETDVVVEKQ